MVVKSRLTRIVLVTASLLLGVWIVSFAQSPSHPTPPFRGFKNSVRALALGSKGDLLLGTFGNGIYRSKDGGIHWEKASKGLTDPYVLTLISGPGEELFAGTARKGVYRSKNQGKQWEIINVGLKSTEVPALLIQGKTIYAGTGEGVFRSLNHGDQWEPYNTGMKRILVRTMTLDKRGFLFAGTEGKGLYRRHPDRSSWTQVTRGFGGEMGILDNFIRTLTIHSDGTMYAGTFDGGVYISKDQGLKWAWWSNGLSNQSIRAVVIGPRGNIFAGTGRGVFARSPSDSEWRLIGPDLEDSSIQAMVIDASGHLYAGTTENLYKGNIKGEWTMITPGFSQTRWIGKKPAEDTHRAARAG